MQRAGHPQKKGNKTTEIYLLPIISYALLIIMGVLCIAAILGIVHGFMRIRSFEVEGTERFVGSEIAAFAGLKRGDLLYDLDEGEARKSILENCAYVERVRLKQKFPSRLCFVIDEREPVWYLKISGDCYVLDGELRVLEETKDEERLVGEGIMALTMPNVKEAMVGEHLVYGSSKEEIENTEKIINSLLSSDIGEHLTAMDIDNRYDIHLTVNGAFEISLGSYSKLDVKLEYLITALQKAYDEGAVGGSVDISDDGGKVSVKPIYNDVGQNTEENQNMG